MIYEEIFNILMKQINDKKNKLEIFHVHGQEDSILSKYYFHTSSIDSMQTQSKPW